MAHGSIRFQVCLLGRETTVQEPSLAASQSIKARLEGAVDLVVEAGDRGEEGRLELSTVFDELQRVTLVVAYFQASEERVGKESLLERMRVR